MIIMGKRVKRITLVNRKSDCPEATVLYKQESGERSGKTSVVLKPLERVARRLLKAEIVASQQALRLHDQSSRRRRNGWVFDAPINIIKARRKAYNEARKTGLFKLLPKA